MVESGVDEGLDGATWPPVPVKHQFAVSEALPLHRLGLVPPPPEIGPHLLTASPLEAALAAASATADLQAIPAPVAIPDPIVAIDDESAPEPAADAEPTPLSTSEVPWSDIAPVTGLDHALAIEVDAPFQIAPPPDASLSAALSAAPTATPVLLPEVPDHGKLLRLDLSRRGITPPAHEMPLPPPPEDEHSETSTVAQQSPPPATLQPKAGIRSDADGSGSEARLTMSPNEPSAGNWPGFLTGFVMAVAIGVGLYVSLVGS